MPKLFATRAFALISFAAVAAASTAQTTVITPFRSLSSGPAVAQSTADVVPQIQSSFSLVPTNIAENPLPRNVFGQGPPNNLRAGGMLSATRGRVGGFFPGIDATGWTPPDCDMAVGPQYIVCTVNSSLAFFRKSDGAKVFQQILGPGGFFDLPGEGTFVFDPKCFYDKNSGRFFVLALEMDEGTSTSKGLIAVSDDNNPNGTWFKYRVELKLSDAGADYWLDYPGWGFNKDGVVLSGNMFQINGNGYAGVQFAVMPKAAMLTGSVFTVSYLRDPNAGTVQIAETVDPAIDRIYGVSNASTTQLKLYAVAGAASGSPSMATTLLSVPSHSGPVGPAASTSGHNLDSIDGRVFTSVFRSGRLYAAHTVGLNSVNQTRWYEIQTNGWPSGSPSLRQSGTISGPSGQHLHMGAINANSAGDISVLYTRSSSSIAADLCYSARFASDALGTIGQPVLLKSTPGPYGGSGTNRWGDYFAVSVDPVDDLTFWGFGMVGKNDGNWTTEISKWTVSTGGANSGTVASAVSITTVLGTLVSGGLTDVATSDNAYYTVSSNLVDANMNPPTGGAPLLGQLTEVEELFQIDPLQPTVANMSLKVEAKAIAGASGMVYFYNWTTSKYEYLAPFSVSSSDKTATIAVKANQSAKYIDASKQVKVRVRIILPVRQGRPTVAPMPFTFGGDLMQLSTGQ